MQPRTRKTALRQVGSRSHGSPPSGSDTAAHPSQPNPPPVRVPARFSTSLLRPPSLSTATYFSASAFSPFPLSSFLILILSFCPVCQVYTPVSDPPDRPAARH